MNSEFPGEAANSVVMTPGTKPAQDTHAILEEIRDNTRTMCIKLFGTADPEVENETGRLAKVERSAKSAHQRLDKIDRIVWKVSGIATAATAVGTVAMEHLLSKIFK